MASHLRDRREARLQCLDELFDGGLLGRCAGVLGLACGVASAHIADADGVGVVAAGVGAVLVERAARLDHAVEVDDVMIADVLPSVAFGWRSGVPPADVGCLEVGAFFGGGAVDDDFIDLSHIISIYS